MALKRVRPAKVAAARTVKANGGWYNILKRTKKTLMPYRRLLRTLILTASIALFLISGHAQAQPGAGSPPLGQPGQAEGHSAGGDRGANAGGPAQPGQPSRPGAGGTAGDAGGAGGANDAGTGPGAAIPKRTAPPL